MVPAVIPILSATSVVVLLLLAHAPQVLPDDLRLRVRPPIPQDLTLGDEVFDAAVVTVEDGDSILIRDSGQQRRDHLAEVDAPELSQPFGTEAKTALAALIQGKQITVRSRMSSPHAAVTGRLTVAGTDVNLWMIKSGHAWYCASHRLAPELERAEQEAKTGRVGLWSTSKPVAPWQFRGAKRCGEQ